MKRMLAVLAAFALTTAAFATPAEEMLKAAPKTEAGLVAMADKAPGNKPAPADNKNAKPTLDPVAFEALILAYADAKVDAKTLKRLEANAGSEADILKVANKREFRRLVVIDRGQRKLKRN